MPSDADPVGSAAPLIGIPGGRRKGHHLAVPLDTYADLDFDVYFADYAQAVAEAGGLPVHLTQEVDPGRIVERLDGLILPGGPDVHPGHYGQGRAKGTVVDQERDAYEFGLLRTAVELDRPVLGICRGLQVVNVYHGGSLHQHVPSHAMHSWAPSEPVHEVMIEPRSIIGRLSGTRLEVNSRHHQAVDSLGTGLVAVGWAEDGIVEAIEHEQARVIAVQWHAEKLLTRSIDPLFAWLVKEATRSPQPVDAGPATGEAQDRG